MGEDKILAPSRSYSMTLKIKGEEYSNDITSIKLTSSLATGYQIVIITLLMTPQTILLDKLHGQDSIKLSIALLDQSEIEKERIDFDLMVLNTEFEAPVTEVMNTKNKEDRSDFSLITVARTPFQIMTTNIGCIFGYGTDQTWGGEKTVKQMIEVIVKQFAPQAKLEYDSDGENTEVISQCCVPPNSLLQGIRYIDSNHGIYNGILSIFCQYDGTIQIMNLSTRIKKNQAITFEHLTTDYKNEDSVDPATIDKTRFYTYDNIYSSYVGNSKFGVLGGTIKHVVLPSNSLFHIITQDLSTFCESYGIIGTDNKETIFIDKDAVNRVSYHIGNNGDDLSETHAIAKISKQISDLARVNFSIEKFLAIEYLIKIGSVVKLETKSMDNLELTGKYILFSSNIVWTKSGEWQTTANIELIRTNKTL